MQSYKLYVVSDHLKDIYPYLELPFNDRYDKTEVYHAVFDRSIPKLIEILLMQGLDAQRYKDALITLNEMVSHQEMKDEMITQGLVEISSAFLHHKVVEIRREAVLLLGSLCTVKQGRDYLSQTAYSAFKNMLFDENLMARLACAWCLNRILTGRDGVDKLVEAHIVRYMIHSFIKFTENPKSEEAQLIIVFLESFLWVLQYDNGIDFFVGSGIIERLNQILCNRDQRYYDAQWLLRINYLCLDALAKISVNHSGKQESIDHKIIETAANFLNSSVQHEVKYSVILIMNCSIHLDGKKQCVFIEDDTVITRLLDKLDEKDEKLRRDVKQALQNIAELPDGFLSITSKLVKHKGNVEKNIDYLDEVFGSNVIIALSELLPKTSKLERPPVLPYLHVDDYKTYCLAICALIMQKEDAMQIQTESIVKLVEKLAPFVVYRNDPTLQDLVIQTLVKICKDDHISLDTLAKYFEQYGEVRHDVLNTTLNSEVQNYKSKELYEMLQQRQNVNEVF